MFSEQATGNTFQAVYQMRDGDFRRIGHKQMNMVVFSVEFKQFRFKVFAYIGENLLKFGQQSLSEYKSTIFGHKDQMHM